MAVISEPTTEERQGYQAWVSERPSAVRAVAERFYPWELYRMKSGQRVVVLSFDEGHDDRVTLTVLVSGEFNLTMFERRVFGVNPDDLEPCDLPSADEVTGAVLSGTQVDDNIDELRVMIRPDLFVRDEATGKAVRKQ